MIDNKKEYKTEHKFWLRNLRKVNNKKEQLAGGRDGVEVRRYGGQSTFCGVSSNHYEINIKSWTYSNE